MSKFFHLTQENKKKKRVSIRNGWIIYIARRILLCLVCMVGIVYLIQINVIVVRGYEAKLLERRINELKQSNEKAELVLTDLRSLDNIQKRTEGLSLAAYGKVNYVEPRGNAVAVR
ncbi:MAG: hypothetical protein HY918_02810 [Candidatus Doudnabacteria bacterium]|nr:hypothetical protein [Candidatus Doudnabacteria bacterium]